MTEANRTENPEVAWLAPDGSRKLVVNEAVYRILESNGWPMEGYVISRPLPTEATP